jgi:hypothetical protein
MCLREQRKLKLSILLATIMACFLLTSIVFAAVPSSAASYSSPKIVQFTSGYSSGGSSSSVQLTFQKPVSKGDIIVVCAGIVSGNYIKITTGSFIDARNVQFKSIVQTSTQIDSLAQVWYGVIGSSGPESITLSYNSGPAALFGYEITPASLSGFSSGTNSGSGTAHSKVMPYDPGTRSLVVACGGFFTLEGVGIVKAGHGYILDQSFNGNDGAEHLSDFSALSSQSPFHFSMRVEPWSEVSVSFIGS